MTENKRFRVTIGNEKDVRLVDYIDNRQLISISFKEHKDAVTCRDALLYQCNLMNELHEENQQLKKELKECKNNKLFSRRELERENKELKFHCNNIREQANEFHRGARENANRVGQLEKENEQLKCGNKNLKAILNDFINICNRLQANPTDKQTLSVARDMLQNMGVDLE